MNPVKATNEKIMRTTCALGHAAEMNGVVILDALSSQDRSFRVLHKICGEKAYADTLSVTLAINVLLREHKIAVRTVDGQGEAVYARVKTAPTPLQENPHA